MPGPFKMLFKIVKNLNYNIVGYTAIVTIALIDSTGAIQN